MLSAEEQIILLEILRRKQLHQRLTFKTQELIKNKTSFYCIIRVMMDKDLLNIVKMNKSNQVYYTLTDFGYLQAVILTKHNDTPIGYQNLVKQNIRWFVSW